MRFLLLTKVNTAISLGLGNVARVAAYRLRLKAGVHKVQRIEPPSISPGAFFSVANASHPTPNSEMAKQTLRYFGWYLRDSSNSIPDWHRNPFNGAEWPKSGLAWWSIPDFEPTTGDIKAIWEASRFDWVVTYAQRSRANGGEVKRLNEWLVDWCDKNPPYFGPNWKCGQEASIRLIHLAIAAMILGEAFVPAEPLVDLVRIHLQRIAPSIGYAIAQENNHGTSEAAALFIGGTWLERIGDATGSKWSAAGRKWLENRTRRLIHADGSFSQYSTNYHRLALDTLSIAEIWRRLVGAPRFSALFEAGAAAASEWLRAMVDPETGDAPNIGANDGANLLPVADADYRDYRPAVQLAMALFKNESAYSGTGPWVGHLATFGVRVPTKTAPEVTSTLFNEGGYAVLRIGSATAIVRYPRFQFRPSHADALHVDLWTGGRNLLRDGGTYSYSADPDCDAYFSGVHGHNTIQFDDHDQMPRLGRFLWGDWLTTVARSTVAERDDATTFSAAYRDSFGAFHRRQVALRPHRLTVVDAVSGFKRRAVLRWRLQPGNWVCRGAHVTNGYDRLDVTADVPVVRFEVVQGWESRYYLQRTASPVLEVEIASAGQLTSEYQMAR